MAAIKLITGDVLLVSADRPTVLNALAQAGGTATGTVNGVQTTVRAAAVVAVSDTVDGLRTVIVAPDPDPTVGEAEPIG